MGPGGKMRTEDTEGTARGPGWREFAGTFGCAVGSSVADGAVRSGVEWLEARARLNWVSQGQGWGRCRVSPAPAERVIRPAREKNRRRRVGGHHLLTQTGPRCPTGQVMRHHRIASQAALAAKLPDGMWSAPRRT